MNQATAAPKNRAAESASPPELWKPEQFRTFRSAFTPQQQRDLLHEDYSAEMGVTAILAALIAIGTVLAIGSVLLIAFA